MLGQLITLPLRVSVRTASLMLRGTEAVLTRALALAGRPGTAEPPPTKRSPAAGGRRAPAGRAARRKPQRDSTRRERRPTREPEPPRDEAPTAPAAEAPESTTTAAPEPADPPRAGTPEASPADAAETAPDAASETAPDTMPETAPAPEVPAAPPGDATPVSGAAAAPPAEEPAHVSEEPEVVREVAEPGVEDGAGAQVTVDEPWEDYARMQANDVIERLATANQAELAAVTLYESAHQARQTVLSAVERQLALVSRGGTSN